ncbi:MAG TPA: hypothetical protein QGF58_29670 [Myxococcota bacterium]|nr:hypothetical protein [Myxococcota bacterium]
MQLAWLWCLALGGCSETSLHSIEDNNGGEVARPARPDRDDNEGDSDGVADTGETGEAGTPEHEPAACSVDTMVHMAGGGPVDCPADHAAFMMDDGTGPNFICCPLPATDILSEVTGLERGTSCGANEVITGFTGQYAYRCSLVNLERYQVGSPAEPCYFGSGSSGGSGVPGCADHPHTWDVLQQNLFGSDGCSGYPYGSLFTSQTGKDCEDMRATVVYYNGEAEGDPPAGTPVEMFLE